MKAAYDEIISTAVKRQHEPQKIVGDLLAAEIREKQARSIKYQMTIARLPLAKEFDELDFDETPVNETLVRDLAGGAFLEQQRNVVPIGGTGTGKSYLAVAIARACLRNGARGRFFNVVDLVNKLDAEVRADRQGRTADLLCRLDFLILDELGYGTPPVGGFTKMPFASTSLGAEQPLLNSELLGYGRDPLAPIKDAVTADGDVVVPIDAEAFGFWLKAAFGAPTTTGTGPWTHEFQSGSWTLPSMSIETGMPEVPRFAMYSGCVLDQITWQMQRSGLLTATARLVAQGETVGTTTSAGTPAALELKRFGHFNGSITRNGSALGNVVSAEITYANNLDRIETIRNDGRIDGADPSIAALTGSIEVRFADSTLVTQAINGEACELEFAYALPSGESFTFTLHAVYLPRPRIEISGPQGVQATFDWQAARDSVVGRMCTATLVNDVETY